MYGCNKECLDVKPPADVFDRAKVQTGQANNVYSHCTVLQIMLLVLHQAIPPPPVFPLYASHMWSGSCDCCFLQDTSQHLIDIHTLHRQASFLASVLHHGL